MKRAHHALSLVVAVASAACGGGSGGESDTAVAADTGGAEVADSADATPVDATPPSDVSDPDGDATDATETADPAETVDASEVTGPDGDADGADTPDAPDADDVADGHDGTDVSVGPCAARPCGNGTCVATDAAYACHSEPISGVDGGSAAVETLLGQVAVIAGAASFVDDAGAAVIGDVTLVVALDGFDGGFAGPGGDVFTPEVLVDLRFEDTDGEPVEVAPGRSVTVVLPLPEGSPRTAGLAAPVLYHDESSGSWALEATGVVVSHDGGLGVSAALGHFTWYGVGAICARPLGCDRVDCLAARCELCLSGHAPTAAGGCEPCPDGQWGDGLECLACAASDVVGCSAVTCTSAAASTCVACASGYTLEAGTCKDLDDCAAAPCGAGTCSDTGANAWSCACPDGSFGDGTRACTTCAASDVVGCSAVTCTSAAASSCVACASGYRLEAGTCKDLDDCAAAPCGAGTCSDTGANAWSCACPDGSFGDGTRACTACGAVDDCLATTCTSASDARCVTCAPGYALDLGACVPVDDCAGQDACDPGVCHDGDQAFTCQCPDGYFGDGATACTPCDPIAGCAVVCTSKADEACADCDERVCEPLDACHVAGVCLPATGECTNPVGNEGGTCDDHDACTIGDTCADGACAGVAKTCAPLDACHLAGSCAPATGICSNPVGHEGGACDDGAAATHTDRCAAGACAGTPVTCPADTACASYAPNGSATCTLTPRSGPCDDGAAATHSDVCSAGACAGTPVTCPADTACMTYTPNGTATCTATARTGGCDDGDAATHTDVCSAGACAGTPVTCPADTTCAGYTPNGSATCTLTPRSGPCDDGDAATHTDVCSAGACLGTAVTCSADTACMTYTPNGTATCTATPRAGSCDDGDAATHSDDCSAGACVGTPVTCPAGTACMTYAPNGTPTCTATPRVGACDDGDAATHSDVCSAGACGGTPVTCPADTACMTHAPNGTATCTATPRTGACDDGDDATHSDVCGAGACAGTPVTCPADTACASYHPDGSAICAVVLGHGACDDHDRCTSGDVCVDGACVGNAVVCDASDACHHPGSCDPETGLCSDPRVADGTRCDDGDACSVDDACVAGACTAGPPKACPGDGGCRVGVCDPGDGSCGLGPGPDFTPCELAGSKCGNYCDDGLCVASGQAIVCDEPGPCQTSEGAACDPATGFCAYPADPALELGPCASADPCLAYTYCYEGQCLGSAKCEDTYESDDQRMCQVAVCDAESGGCGFVDRPDGTDCDDGDPCTVDDACHGGTCTSRPYDCNHSCSGSACLPRGYAYADPAVPLAVADAQHDAAGARGDSVPGDLGDGLTGDYVGLGAETAIVFTFPQSRQLTTMTIGMRVDEGDLIQQPPTILVEFASLPPLEGEIVWGDPSWYTSQEAMLFTIADGTLPVVADGTRGEVELVLGTNDETIDVFTHREGGLVRVTFGATEGLALIDEVSFGEPPSLIPRCMGPAVCAPHPAIFGEPYCNFDQPLEWGTPCDDDNACTDGDQCMFGSCEGTQRQCDLGELSAEELQSVYDSDNCRGYQCDRRTGLCELTDYDGQVCNPTTSCGPRRACSEEEWCNVAYGSEFTCQGGQCQTEGVPTVHWSDLQCGNYGPPDQCHLPATCVPNVGAPQGPTCSYPSKPLGTGCDDQNPCTVDDNCQATCFADGSCSTTTCGGTPLPVGSVCTRCYDVGLCVAGQNPWDEHLTFCDYGNFIPPPELGPCQVPGEGYTCEPTTGAWGPVVDVPDGTPCYAGSLCSGTVDECHGGECVTVDTPGEELGPEFPCIERTECDPATGNFRYVYRPNGTPCNDTISGIGSPDNLCTQSTTCTDGECRFTGPDVQHKLCDASCRYESFDFGSWFVYPEDCSPEGYVIGDVEPAPERVDGPLTDGVLAEAGDADPAWVDLGQGTIVLRFEMQRQRDFSDLKIGVLGGAAPETIAVSTSPDGVTFAGDRTFEGFPVIPQGERGELTLVLDTATDPTHTAPWHERGWLKLVMTSSAPLRVDEVVFGPPPSITPKCRAFGYCFPLTGACIYDYKLADATPCDDEDLCTQVDLCDDGTCAGTTPIVCEALDQCHVVGTCDPATGVCDDPAAQDDTPCDDADPCTGNLAADPTYNDPIIADTCQGGLCTAGSATMCQPAGTGPGHPEQCFTSFTCGGAAGACLPDFMPDDVVCNDANANTGDDHCFRGACIAGFDTCVGLEQGVGWPTVAAGGTVTGSVNDMNTHLGVRRAWAEGTSAIFTPGALPADPEWLVLKIDEGAPDPYGWYDSYEGAPDPGIEVPEAEGYKNVWWPVVWQPCQWVLNHEVHMTMRYNATTDLASTRNGQPYPAGSPAHTELTTDLVIAHTTNLGTSFILPDWVDPERGVLGYRAGELGHYVPVVEVPWREAPEVCVSDYDCNDRDLSTLDECTAGLCTNTPRTCPPPDACHEPGVVGTDTGLCTFAPKTGTTCDDGQACTHTDTCQAGACVGTETVCVAMDQCHVPGVCDRPTGVCSDPEKPNGALCNDADACTTIDTCQAGVCMPGAPLTCRAKDACHAVGTCDPATGCSDPELPDQTACDDRNACTIGTVCLSGVCGAGSPLICPDLSVCHSTNACDPVRGCTYSDLPNGTACADDNACTQVGACSSGVCQGQTGTTCPAVGACEVSLGCDPNSGLCGVAPKADGAPCNDDDLCTTQGSCQAGQCTNLPPTACGWNPNDPRLVYAYTTGAPICYASGGGGAPTCHLDGPHGTATSYATGLLTDGQRGGAIGGESGDPTGGWVAIQGTASVVLRANASRPLTTLTVGLGNTSAGGQPVAQPSVIEVAFSDSGTAFSGALTFSLAAQTLPVIPSGQRADVHLDIGGRSARFVRVTLTNAAAAWTFLDELALGAPCQIGGCNPATGACTGATARADGSACGGPGDTCRAGACTSCSAKGLVDCNGVCLASCETPSPTTCNTALDCVQVPWLAPTCVGGTCRYGQVACDGADVDLCSDGWRRPDGSCRESGPVLLWNFDDAAATTIVDDSGFGRSGNKLGDGLAFDDAGRFGKALELTGSHTSAVSRAVSVPATDFTIMAHFKTPGAENSFVFGAFPVNGSAYDRYALILGGRVRQLVAYPSWYPTTSSPIITDNQWHHATLVCKARAGCTSYLDGVAYSTSPAWADRSRYTSDVELEVGRGFTGLIDQVALYEFPMTAAEVQVAMAGIDTPAQGDNRPRCDGVDHACTGAATVDTACDDGDPCTAGERCAAGACVGTAVTCPTGQCFGSSCNLTTGACDRELYAAAVTCNDGDPMTSTDRCESGTCRGYPVAGATTGTPAPPAMQQPVNFLKRLQVGPRELLTDAEAAVPTCTVGKDCDAIEYVSDDVDQKRTAYLAPGMEGQTLPRATISLQDANVLYLRGRVHITTDTGVHAVSYTGRTATELLGCTGGTGTMGGGNPITQYVLQRWMIVTVTTQDGTGFVGWLPVCATDNGACTPGAPVIANKFRTYGPGYYYWSPELYKKNGAPTHPAQILLPTASTDFVIDLGPPLSASGRITVPFPRNKLTGGWDFDPPFVAAGFGQGRDLTYLNAPLHPDRGYLYGGMLAGLALTFPGSEVPFPVGAQATAVLDPSDPMIYVALFVPPGQPTSWLNGSFGFSWRGNLRHRSAIKLWNGTPLPLGTFLSDVGNEAASAFVTSPAHFYLTLKKAFEIPGIRASLSVDGKLSMYFGADLTASQLAFDWSQFAKPKPTEGFVKGTQKFSSLLEGTVGLQFPMKLGALSIPLGIPLGSAAFFVETDPTASPPRSKMQFRGTTTELGLDKIPGMEWTKMFQVHAEVAGYFENPNTACEPLGTCEFDDLGMGLRMEVAAPIVLPGAVLPFRGTFQFAKLPEGPLDLSLDARITGGVIGLAPGLTIEVGTVALDLQYDGEKFCAGTSVEAGQRDVRTSSTQTQSTSCSMRLCMGAKDDFWKGTTLDCAPFCADDSQCDGGQVCIYGSCDAPRLNGLACDDDGACQSGTCYLGLCKDCTPGSWDECGDTKYCDAIGYCVPRFGEGGSCWFQDEARSDLCASGLVCDRTGPASAICHHCYAPGVYNQPLVGDIGGGCADQKRPRDVSATHFCNVDGDCQARLDFGESCFAVGLGAGIDQMCKKPIGKSEGDCGDPAWTCRECGYDNLPGGIPPDALANPAPACAAGEYCHGGSLTCRSKLGIGESCGNAGGADDRKCASGACDRVCFSYASKSYGESCVQSGHQIAGMCKSGQCLADGTCGCSGVDANCGSGKFCDLAGYCQSKQGTGAACAGVGASACIDNACSVFGDALPGFCYQPSSKSYDQACYANAECKSGQCKAGRCGCGHKASQCGSNQFCGGADGDICINKMAAGLICQQDGRQCTSGQCNYFSPGVYVCGCTGDEQCAPGDYCDVSSGANICKVRKPAGAACNRAGECWRLLDGQPAACVHNTWSCGCHDCNCDSCAIPCVPNFWNVCGYFDCFCESCCSTCSSDTCALTR